MKCRTLTLAKDMIKGVFNPLLLSAKCTKPKTAYTLPPQIRIKGNNVSIHDKKSNFSNQKTLEVEKK